MAKVGRSFNEYFMKELNIQVFKEIYIFLLKPKGLLKIILYQSVQNNTGNKKLNNLLDCCVLKIQNP